jgi:probable phosphoglycerate mutase
VDELWLVRHGETEWSRTGRHTSVTDVPLTEEGRDAARALGGRLNHVFSLVLSSPSQRALQTAELAGFEDRVDIDDDLVEYAYGDYEGRTTDQILAERPSWDLWTDGCPNGETASHVARRVDRVLQRIRTRAGSVLLFAHGHVLRVLAARYLGLAGDAGRYFVLDAAALSVLAAEHGRPAVKLWNAPAP